MYCLRQFIVVLHELHYNVYCIIVMCSLKSVCIPSYVLIGCCVSELHGHLCPYRKVWPEAVHCCFTRTTLFTIHIHACMIRVRGCYHLTFVALHLTVFKIAKCIA